MREIAADKRIVRGGLLGRWDLRHMFGCAGDEDWDDFIVFAQRSANEVVDVADQRVKAAVAAICLGRHICAAVQAAMELLHDQFTLAQAGRFAGSHVRRLDV